MPAWIEKIRNFLQTSAGGRSERYSYEPLDERQRQIRLFELLPGKKKDPLCGRLTTVNLEGCPPFDAVSYVWGDPEIRFELTVDGDKTLMVLESLRGALTALRLKRKSRILWIDAICIDQNNKQERGQQVGLMGVIYTTASYVRVWLDVDVKLNSPAFRAVEALEDQPPAIAELFHNEELTDGRLPRTLQLRDRSVEFWEPLYEIFDHPYWERVWTQQELFLARNLRFHLPRGVLLPEPLIRFDWAVTWTHARPTQAAALAPDGRYLTWMRGRSIFNTLHYGFDAVRAGRTPQPGDTATLLKLFLGSKDLKTSDPRDRVYGFVGLAQDCDEGDIDPNYLLTPVEVYFQVIRHFIGKYKSLDFLCNTANSRDHSQPSWLPSPEKESYLLSGLLNISKATEIPVDPEAGLLHNGVLLVRGMKCDTIIATASNGTLLMPILTWWKELEEMCVTLGVCKSSDQILTSKTVLELLGFGFDTFMYQDVFAKPSPTLKQLEEMFSSLIEFPTRTNNMDVSIYDIVAKMTLGPGEENLRIARMLLVTMTSSTFIGTKGKRLGSSLQSCSECKVESGDEAWVLFGCSMPMVLRPTAMGQFSVIGPAIIPGLMKGEACEGLMSDGTAGPEYHGPQIQEIDLV